MSDDRQRVPQEDGSSKLKHISKHLGRSKDFSNIFAVERCRASFTQTVNEDRASPRTYTPWELLTKVVQRILRHSRPHVTKGYIKVFDRTLLEAAEKLQQRVEELRQAKGPCRKLELGFGDGVEPPRTALAECPAFGRLADSSLPGQQLASTLS